MKRIQIFKGLTVFSLAAALGVTSAFAFPMLPARAASAGETFTNPNNGASYQWVAREDGNLVLYKDGVLDSNEFVSDGTYTYYCQTDGTIMHDKLTYHPDGQHVIYFDWAGHEVFNAFTNVKTSITGEAVDDQCYFNANGYMYVNTVTYDVTGTKLYYINPQGQLEHNGFFAFDVNTEYGDTGRKWALTGSYIGYANYDGTLMVNATTYDVYGNAYYMQANGEAKKIVQTYTLDELMQKSVNYYLAHDPYAVADETFALEATNEANDGRYGIAILVLDSRDIGNGNYAALPYHVTTYYLDSTGVGYEEDTYKSIDVRGY